MSLIIMGMETNLKPVSESDAWIGDHVFHVKGDNIIPAILMEVEYTGGKLSPVIQYLNSDGDVYRLKDRPKDFEQYISVDESELMAA